MKPRSTDDCSIPVKRSLRREPLTREELLSASSSLIENLTGRLARKRVSDDMRLRYGRLLAEALSVHSRILQTRDLDELEDRLDEIETAAKRKR